MGRSQTETITIRVTPESERESFRSYRQKNHSVRSNMVDSSHSHGSSNAVGTALMGIRGIANLTDLFENGEESEEEKRQREARNAGSAHGVIAGLAVGAVIDLTQQQSTPAEDIEDDEDEGFDITM